MIRKISSWGNLQKKEVTLTEELGLKKGLISVGNNNSYGDAAIPMNPIVLERKSKVLDTNFYDSSILIDEYMSQTENILYGVPGRENVTLGGAVASDVHGKDGSWGSSFSRNIKSLHMLLPNGEEVVCSDSCNQDLFFSTIGGFGLTGSILGIEFNKSEIPFFTHCFSNTVVGQNINELLKLFTNTKFNYQVAWVNLLKNDKKWVFTNSSIYSEIKKNDIKNIKYNNEFNFSIPLIGFNYFKTLSFINNIYCLVNSKNKQNFQTRQETFYPLGKFSNTKNIASNRKIIQVQFSVPIENESHIEKLLDLLIKNQHPLLCSIKFLQNSQQIHGLSFVQKGWAIAVDFPAKNFDHISIRNFYSRLIEIGGKVYLAKDSTLNQNEFSKMFNNLEEWRDIVKKIDPKNLFQSELSKRLGIKNW